MLNTYIVEGGIGKHAAFTALIPKLVERDGEAVQIHSPYVDAFAFNPGVKMAYDQGSIGLGDPRITASENIHYCEPYKSNFVKGSEHIIEAYCRLLGVEYDDAMVPKLYTTHLKDRASEWLEKRGITGPYMMIQFSGGQTPVGFNPVNAYQSTDPGRNYPWHLVNKVVAGIRAAFPDIAIIDCTLPNEPGYPDTHKCDEHWAVVHEMLKGAQGFIGIDSCLNHFSASTKTRGVVIWGSTRWVQFGYDHNSNMSFHQGETWDESKFDALDPRNILVDPDAIVEQYLKGVNTHVGRNDGRADQPSVRCLRA